MVRIAAAAAAALAGYWLLRRLRGRKRCAADVSTPRLLPISMGTVIREMMRPTQPLWMLEQSRRAGPVFSISFPTLCDTVVVADPVLARTILMEPTCSKPFIYTRLAAFTLDVPSVFSRLEVSSGSQWHQQRKGLVPAFAPSKVAAMKAACAACYDRWMASTLEPAIASGASIDVCAELLRVTIQFIHSAAFAYEATDGECTAMLHDLETTMRVTTRVFLPLPRSRTFWWAFAEGRAWRAASLRTRAAAMRILEHYRALPAEAKARASGTIIAHIDANESYPSDEERCADIVVLLIAGHDTTALSLAW
jgi:cytochrome P450